MGDVDMLSEGGESEMLDEQGESEMLDEQGESEMLSEGGLDASYGSEVAPKLVSAKARKEVIRDSESEIEDDMNPSAHSEEEEESQ